MACFVLVDLRTHTGPLQLSEAAASVPHTTSNQKWYSFLSLLQFNGSSGSSDGCGIKTISGWLGFFRRFIIPCTVNNIVSCGNSQKEDPRRPVPKLEGSLQSTRCTVPGTTSMPSHDTNSITVIYVERIDTLRSLKVKLALLVGLNVEILGGSRCC
jgi:hypothetical protein